MIQIMGPGNEEVYKPVHGPADRRNLMRSKISILVLLFLLAGIASTALTKEKKFPIDGSVTNRYKMRSTGEIADHDWETMLSLNWHNPNVDRFSAAVSGGGIFDIDGKGNDRFFTDIYNSFSGNGVGRLYYAWLNANRLGPVANARAGRQHLYQLDSLYFDGASLESVPYYGVTFNAFGGSPVHLFENQIGIDPGDWVLGGGLQWVPISKIRIRYDYVHLKDKITGFRITQADQEDDLMGGSIWFNVSDHVSLFGRLTSFTDQLRDVEGSSTLRYPDHKLTVRLNVRRLLESYAVRVIDWDAYGIAGSYRPYTEGSLGVTKGLGEKFVIDGGMAIRRLDDRQFASSFNHGFEKIYAAAASNDVPFKGLELSTGIDYYRGEDSTLKNNSFGVSASAHQNLFKKKLRVGGGTAHYLYRYNLLAGDESRDVQVYFAEAEAKIAKPLKAKAHYEFENNDYNGFHTFTVGVTWNF